jgi:hypothetical protein
MNEKNIGNNFDSFLLEENLLQEATDEAVKYLTALDKKTQPELS